MIRPGIAVFILLLIVSAHAEASAAADDGPRSGTLLLHGPGLAHALPAVRLGTDIDVTITGAVARVRVTQAFRNTGTRWMEARYLHPLPDDGAVDGLKMVVGQRVIVGRIERRAAARQVYEQAKTRGARAGLVEQQRPNLFTTAVANVGPGETVLVAIDYQAPVRQVGGTFALRLPLAVTPRYVPPHTLGASGGAADAAAVTAPLLDPRTGRTANPVSIAVHLAPGFPLANLISAYHRVTISGDRADAREVRLAAGAVPADRDFELRWRSAAAEPTVALFRQRLAGKEYVMASITPPADTGTLAATPRELVFVIDNSGSMGGASMREAKASLLQALATLTPRDRFNVIRFDDTMTQLFPQAVPATAERLAVADRFVAALEASGGTEMLPALRAALANPVDGATLRQVIFLTDGAVSNEAEMIAALGSDGGRSRLFFVGIGSAPNTYLMRRMAAIGRGTFTHVGAPEEVAARMAGLLDQLRRPALQDLVATPSDGAIELTPARLPDLYAGEPLVLLGRADALGGTLALSGRIGGRRWSRTLDLAQAAESPAVAKLWARARIDDAEADRLLGRVPDAAARAAVEALGLGFGLVTAETSLVAVDDTPARPEGARLTREELPIDLPAGWDFDALFGGATEAGSRDGLVEEPALPLDLPQTASGFVARMVQGLLLMLAGGLGLLLRRRAAA